MDSIQLWREKICLSIDPTPIKSNHDIRHFFLSPQSDNTSHVSRKRKRDRPAKIKAARQGQLMDFEFTKISPTSPSEEEEKEHEIELPLDFEEMIQRKQLHKNRKLVQQSQVSTTYQQRIK